LAKLGKALEATKTPPECVARRKRMGEDAAALAQLTTKLGHEGTVDREEFSALVAVQETRLHRYGHDLADAERGGDSHFAGPSRPERRARAGVQTYRPPSARSIDDARGRGFASLDRMATPPH
jgi:hypothetical protein